MGKRTISEGNQIKQANNSTVKVQVAGLSYYMDGYLKQNLDHLKRAVANKWDGVMVVDGLEGGGKTNIGKCIAHYCSEGKFNLDNVVFTPQQFMDAVVRAKPGEAILWDEFILAGLSTEGMNQMQNALIKFMTTIRKRRLFIILVVPWIFMLRTYFAVGRSRCLIHVYSHDGIQRGRFVFYNYIDKSELYFKGKRFFKYDVKPSFYGVFTKYDGLFYDEEEYEKKKDTTIQNLGKSSYSSKSATWLTDLLGHLFYDVRIGYPELITMNNLINWTGSSDTSIKRYLSYYKKKLKNVSAIEDS